MEIEWTDVSKQVHPALDFKDGNVYVGVGLPVKTEKGIRENLCLIDNMGKIHFPDEPNPEIAVSHFIIPNGRWSRKSIWEFTHRKEKDVNIKEIFTKIVAEMKKYIDLPNPVEYDIVALWIIGTYFHPLFNSFPYIQLQAPTESGKTKCGNFVNLLAFNSIHSANTSTSAMFRQIAGYRSTLIIDENENLHKSQMVDYRSILLSGYKNGAAVMRTEEMSRKGVKQFINKYFPTYSPKFISNIFGLEAVLANRCIDLPIERSDNDEILNRELNFQGKEWVDLKDSLYLLLFQSWEEIEDIYKNLNLTNVEPLYDTSEVEKVEEVAGSPDTMQNDLFTIKHQKTPYIINPSTKSTSSTQNDNFELIRGRELELWKPLLSLAKWVGEGTFVETFTFAVDKVKERRQLNLVDIPEIGILEAIDKIYDEDNYYFIKKLTAAAKEGEMEWVTPRWIGSALSRLGFRKRRKVKGITQVFINRDHLDKMLRKYGVTQKESESER